MEEETKTHYFNRVHRKSVSLDFNWASANLTLNTAKQKPKKY